MRSRYHRPQPRQTALACRNVRCRTGVMPSIVQNNRARNTRSPAAALMCRMASSSSRLITADPGPQRPLLE